jgi:SprT protein
VKHRSLDKQQQGRVCAATSDCLRRAGEIYGIDPQPVPVSFDLKGRSAGMYQVQRGQRRIRYNPYIFFRYLDDNLAATVPHEVAHYVTDLLYGLRNVRPHGREWKSVMKALGAEPRVTANYDLDDMPIRRQQRYTYRCQCSTHQLSACRHNRIGRGDAAYLCRKCGVALSQVDEGKASA